jgi:hypothetical protein
MPRTEEFGYTAKYYNYRVRAQNYAGVYSEWSEVSRAAPTGVPEEVISQVSNYPNPVDFRKEKEAYITYVLNEDAEVSITLYDLLGYKVREWSITPDQGEHQGTGKAWVEGTGKGAKAGTNIVIWNGENESGNPVSKGGYIAHIVVRSKKGTFKTIRKIGVVR